MKILLSLAFLDGYHGSVMHIKELGEGILRNKKLQDAEVTIVAVFATKEIKERLFSCGLVVHSMESLDVSETYDIVISYHYPIVGALLDKGLRCKKLVLGTLSVFETLETFPTQWPAASLLLAISEEAKAWHCQKYGIPSEKIFVMGNWLPDEFLNFNSAKVYPADYPRKIAVVSHHVPPELKALASVIPSQEVTFDCIGKDYQSYKEITPVILMQYDLVITIGKTVQYCMGMQIPVYEYDYFGGVGYIDPEGANQEAWYNFSGRATGRKLTGKELWDDILGGYPLCVKRMKALHDIAVERYLLSKNIDILLDKINESPDFDDQEGIPYNAALESAHNEAFCRWLNWQKKGRFKAEAQVKKLAKDVQNHKKSIVSLKRNNKILREEKKTLEKKISLMRNTRGYKLLTRFRNFRDMGKRGWRHMRKYGILSALGRGMKEVRAACRFYYANHVRLKIFCVLAVKDEEYYLPGFFQHIRDYVDGFIVLDDGSTDATLSIIKKEKKVKAILKNPPHDEFHWDERGNRIALLNASRKHGAAVVLCCDADERFETGFLESLRELASECHRERCCMGLKVCEMWDSLKKYRVDGVWDKKKKYMLFPLAELMTFEQTMTQEHHIYWHYDALTLLKMTDFNLYHLKMIKEADRIKRSQLYARLDPECKMQKIGYSYLTDEKNMRLLEIPESKEYDVSSLPRDLLDDYGQR